MTLFINEETNLCDIGSALAEFRWQIPARNIVWDDSLNHGWREKDNKDDEKDDEDE